MTLLSMSALLSPGKSQFTDKSRRAPRIKGSSKSQERDCGSTVCLKTKIKSNQIKSLLLSHHHSTSALVSEILMSVLQTVQKNNKQFTYGQTVQKKQQTIYIWTDSAKNNNLHMDSTYLQTVQKTMCKIHIHILSTRSVL